MSKSQEHKVTASETAQLKKLDKLIVEKERLLAVIILTFNVSRNNSNLFYL